MAEHVEGIGGVFFRARDPEALRSWYAEHLGIEMEDYGTTFTIQLPAAERQVSVVNQLRGVRADVSAPA